MKNLALKRGNSPIQTDFNFFCSQTRDSMKQIYIIDDHRLIIEGFCHIYNLDPDFKVAGGSLTVEDALQKISSGKTGMIILDLFIKESDPVSNFKKIHEAFPSIPVIILSDNASVQWQAEMFRLGVKSFIDKSADAAVIRQKIRRVFAGETIVPGDAAKILITGENPPSAILFAPEYKEIVRLLTLGMTVSEIAIKLEQSDSYIEKKLHRIRDYFNVKSNCELIYLASLKKLPYIIL